MRHNKDLGVPLWVGLSAVHGTLLQSLTQKIGAPFLYAINRMSFYLARSLWLQSSVFSTIIIIGEVIYNQFFHLHSVLTSFSTVLININYFHSIIEAVL